jgi:cysteine-rich repeat protein
MLSSGADRLVTRPRISPALLAAALAAVSCGGPPQRPGELFHVAEVCGDGVVQGTEECDDANASNEDSCLTHCYRPVRWVTGDPHIHTSGCETLPRTPGQLSELIASQGLDVASVLVWGDGYENDAPRFTGSDDPASRDGRILHYDLEVSAFRAAEAGHLVLLGLRSIAFSPTPFDTPESGVPIVDWAHAQGDVAVGMAHGQFWLEDGSFPLPGLDYPCCVPFELPVHVARGRLSFLITERRGSGPALDERTFLLWKSLLNAGFRVGLTGASDFPCINKALNETTPRTDAILDGDLTYARWIDAIRRGRTVAATGYGNRLNMRVNGTLLGGEVRVAAGELLNVSIEARFPEPTVVELVANAAPLASVRLDAGAQVATLRLPATASQWLIARTPRAATSPVYVVVDGRPIRPSAADACYLVRYVDHLTNLVTSRRIPMAGSQAQALAAYAEARAELLRRFTEAGGRTCP